MYLSQSVSERAKGFAADQLNGQASRAQSTSEIHTAATQDPLFLPKQTWLLCALQSHLQGLPPLLAAPIGGGLLTGLLCRLELLHGGGSVLAACDQQVG